MSQPSRLPAAVAFSTLAAAVVAVAGCERKPVPAVKAAPPEVTVALPTSQKINNHEDFTGRTEPFRSVDIRPQVTGELKAVRFEDGDYVAKGDVLFEIERDLFEADLKKAKADVENWKAQIELAKADMERAKISLNRGVVSQADYDKAVAQRDVAVAQLDASAAMVAKADRMVRYCTIRAPFAGRLSRRQIDPGNIVKENETVLTTLKVLDPIYVTFDIDERTLLGLRRLLSEGEIKSARDSGLQVQVGLADEDADKYPYSAPLTFFDNALDQSTGTLRLRAEMRNPSLQKGLPAVVGAAAALPAEIRNLRLLSPGMFVRVRLPVGEEKSKLMIPEQALGSDQGQRFVYVVNDQNKAEYRRVKVGPEVDQMRVIESGLQPAERVVVKGLQRVAAGREVRVAEGKGKAPRPPAAAGGLAAAK